jgi:hypothetical protein
VGRCFGKHNAKLVPLSLNKGATLELTASKEKYNSGVSVVFLVSGPEDRLFVGQLDGFTPFRFEYSNLDAASKPPNRTI